MDLLHCSLVLLFDRFAANIPLSIAYSPQLIAHSSKPIACDLWFTVFIVPIQLGTGWDIIGASLSIKSTMSDIISLMEDTRIGGVVKALDAFPKVDTAYLQKTKSGGLITLITYGLMAALMCAELFYYLLPPLRQYYVVDQTISSQVPLELDISVATECEKLVLLQSDEAGGTRVLNEELEAYSENFSHLKSSVRYL